MARSRLLAPLLGRGVWRPLAPALSLRPLPSARLGCRARSTQAVAAAQSLAVPTPSLAVSPLEITRMPPLKFGGRVVLVSTPEDEQRAEPLLKDELLLGFDTESKPSSGRLDGQKNRTALIQVASEKVVCIWRISELGSIPPFLTKLLEDPEKHKVGQGAAHEVVTLRDEWGVSPQGFIDLHHIALDMKTTPRSLQGLVALFLKKRLSKEQRLTNWEQTHLTQAQIEYAATDAWASRQVLVSMRQTFLTEKLTSERLIGSKVRGLVNASSPFIADRSPTVEKITDAAPPPVDAAESNVDVRRETPRVAAATEEEAPRPSLSSSSLLSSDEGLHIPVEAHRALASLCVDRGYVLRFDGFESASSGFRCIFRVEYRHRGHTVAEAFRSKRPHTSLRAAQNDAAAQAIMKLKPLLVMEGGDAGTEDARP